MLKCYLDELADLTSQHFTLPQTYLYQKDKRALPGNLQSAKFPVPPFKHNLSLFPPHVPLSLSLSLSLSPGFRGTLITVLVAAVSFMHETHGTQPVRVSEEQISHNNPSFSPEVSDP
jgi:hypothetical protein